MRTASVHPARRSRDLATRPRGQNRAIAHSCRAGPRRPPRSLVYSVVFFRSRSSKTQQDSTPRHRFNDSVGDSIFRRLDRFSRHPAPRRDLPTKNQRKFFLSSPSYKGSVTKGYRTPLWCARSPKLHLLQVSDIGDGRGSVQQRFPRPQTVLLPCCNRRIVVHAVRIREDGRSSQKVLSRWISLCLVRSFWLRRYQHQHGLCAQRATGFHNDGGRRLPSMQVLHRICWRTAFPCCRCVRPGSVSSSPAQARSECLVCSGVGLRCASLLDLPGNGAERVDRTADVLRADRRPLGGRNVDLPAPACGQARPL